MAEESLVRGLLMDKMLDSGGRLLKLLHEQRFPFRAALWVYLSEAEEWRLFLAVPGARAEGKMKFYKRLQDVLARDANLPRLSALAIVDSKDPLIHAAGPAIKVADVGKHHFSSGTLNGRRFENAYVYRASSCHN
jgi:hypothetical protein